MIVLLAVQHLEDPRNYKVLWRMLQAIEISRAGVIDLTIGGAINVSLPRNSE